MTRLEFQFVVPASHPALPGHFPGRSVVPGVLVLDEVVAGLNRATGLVIDRLSQVKFVSAMLPAEAAAVLVEFDEVRADFRVSVCRNGKKVPLARGIAVFREPLA